MRLWIVRAAVTLEVCLVFGFASDRSFAQSAAAQELFDSAKKLTKEGKFAEACPKFDESHRLDPAPGTQFFLADCWERTGKTASAWAAYSEVADQSKAAGQKDREKVARERAQKLVPRLHRLSIVVPPEARIAGLVVKRDGVVLREPQWGVAVPIDPGEHVIEASAPNTEPWKTTADMTGEGRTTTIDVPKLGPVGSKPAAVFQTSNEPTTGEEPVTSDTPIEKDRPPSSNGSGQRTIGLVLGGVGVIGIGVGSYFGLRSFSKHKDYESRCPENRCTDQTGVDLNDQAKSAGTISTIAFGVGLAALTTGVVLYLTAPKAKTTVGVAPRLGGASLEGKF